MKFHLAAYAPDGTIKYYCVLHDKATARLQNPPDGGGIKVLWKKPDNLDEHSKKYFVKEGRLVERTEMPIAISKTEISADGRDETSITGIPAGALATITGALSAGPVQIDDGELIVTSNKPGKLHVELRLQPTHHTWRTSINAT
jgi:hypothetical protein